MVNRIWPTAVAGEADSVSSLTASACHIGGRTDVNPGDLTLVYGSVNVTNNVLLTVADGNIAPVLVLGGKN